MRSRNGRKNLEREFEINKIKIQETSIEHFDVNKRTNPFKQYDLLRLLTKYYNSSDISLCLAMYEIQMAQTSI